MKNEAKCGLNHFIFAIGGLLLLASCEKQSKSPMLQGDFNGARTRSAVRSQEAIAKEILSIEYNLGDEMVQLNNTNAVGFVAKVKALAERLDQISKELDGLGPFPPDLRKATLKKLDDAEKVLAQLFQSRKSSDSLQPEDAKTINPVMEKYLSAWISVLEKARLFIEAKKEVSAADANGQGTNKSSLAPCPNLKDKGPRP